MGNRKTLQNPLQNLEFSFYQTHTALNLKHRGIVLDILCRRSPVDILGHLVGRAFDQLPN